MREANTITIRNFSKIPSSSDGGMFHSIDESVQRVPVRHPNPSRWTPSRRPGSVVRFDQLLEYLLSVRVKDGMLNRSGLMYHLLFQGWNSPSQ
jgi:hypothetical protein